MTREPVQLGSVMLVMITTRGYSGYHNHDNHIPFSGYHSYDASA